MESAEYLSVMLLIFIIVFIISHFLEDIFDLLLSGIDTTGDFFQAIIHLVQYNNIDSYTLYKKFSKVTNRNDFFEIIGGCTECFFRRHRSFTLEQFANYVDMIQSTSDKYFSTYPPKNDAYHIIMSRTVREALLDTLNTPALRKCLKKCNIAKASKSDFVKYLYSITKDDYRHPITEDIYKAAYNRSYFHSFDGLEMHDLLTIERTLLGEDSRLFLVKREVA